MNVSVYPYINSKTDKQIAFISIPKNLYSKEYFYKVEDNRSYFVFNLMHKGILIQKFIYYYSSSLYYYIIDDDLNITFYEKKNIRLSTYDNFFLTSCAYYYQYKKSDGTIYEKYLKSKAIKNDSYIKVGDVNSYGDKCIQFYKVYYFNFK